MMMIKIWLTGYNCLWCIADRGSWKALPICGTNHEHLWSRSSWTGGTRAARVSGDVKMMMTMWWWYKLLAICHVWMSWRTYTREVGSCLHMLVSVLSRRHSHVCYSSLMIQVQQNMTHRHTHPYLRQSRNSIVIIMKLRALIILSIKYWWPCTIQTVSKAMRSRGGEPPSGEL